MKTAVIFGSDGQDGYYLVRHLLEQEYQVYGVMRKKTRYQQDNDLLANPRYHQLYADLMDLTSLINAIGQAKPEEIYNLAGLSEIPISWIQPSLTAEVNAIGVTRLLEAVRVLDPNIRLFQASSSEMFGDNPNNPLNEDSSFCPRNPYGTAKVFAHWTVSNYRAHYGLYACSGILFNHESPRRSPEFVTRKIAKAAAELKLGRQDALELGDLYAVRDWGHAADYVRAMWMLLQQPKPDDYVVATGVGHTVKEFAQTAFQAAGITLAWEGEGMDETARDAATGRLMIRVNPKLCRNVKDDRIVGDPAKITKTIGFKPTYTFEEMVAEIVNKDLERLLER
ncbi:GDP-mannose 4,6-dehydratase [Candidatus Allofournierella merdavium]|uniref:GDP-mannose 4,6-dehydratase n=1 Tax=Candidatus Allofournierella merdavium TaxID=2838593 RepID=UPI00374E94D9